MTALPDLENLIAAARGADREIDAAICIALNYGGPNSDGCRNVRTDDDWEGDLLFEVGAEECCNRIPDLTASLDAALALVERCLPGWSWHGGNESYDGENKAWARLYPGYGRMSEGTGNVYAPTPALALLLAMVRAIRAQQEVGRG